MIFKKKTILNGIVVILPQELFLQNALIKLLEIFLNPVFETGEGNWFEILPTKTKQYKKE